LARSSDLRILSETSGDFVAVAEHPTRAPAISTANEIRHGFDTLIFLL
jgi:hypothetical protein